MRKLNRTEYNVLNKSFKKGDIVIATSERSATSMCIATGMWVSRYEKDISYEDAINIHYENMKRDYPMLELTFEDIKNALKSNDKYFLNDRHEVLSYRNHEKADAFDLIYFDNKGNKIALRELSQLKDQYVTESKIKPTIYEGDEWPQYRVYEDVEIIKEWIKKKIENNL